MTEASFEGAHTDDRGVGHFYFNSGVSRGSLVDRNSIVVDIERATVRGSRHGGYRLQRYEKVYKGITDESSRHEIFKGRVDFISPPVSQNAGYKPSNVKGWPRVKVTETLSQCV